MASANPRLDVGLPSIGTRMRVYIFASSLDVS
jgi:hypothetical protein